MNKTFAALGLALGLTAGALTPAPALASDRDMVGPALAGLGLLAVVAAASMANRDQDRDWDGDGRRLDVRNAPQAPAWGYPEPDRRGPDVRRDAPVQHALPGDCTRDMRHDGRRQGIVSERCLRDYGIRRSDLPARCETGSNGWGRPGQRTGWSENCLRSHGYDFR